ncbi:phage tail tape measure protein [Glutamicibacter sp. FBE19]|uniref:phage tail tape measure protein n=1 Tax=Glutamicibacter sp. FBE19 TaxID=2761534 RepID=UPI0018967206|nr:phage tail tape measure protein [Glutamicibacter sp. FBE19]MBF6672448.1 phage tail tape measure protein [Glutamicibacter sp. FBE19]
MARTVKLEIDAKVTGLVNGLKTAQKATQDSAREFDKWTQAHEDSLNTVGQGMTAFGVVAAAGVAVAVKSFADFDKAMSSVRAASHESAENMELLREAAIDAGADTAFSAAEAAQGIEELAKAGVSTKDVLSGGLNGALDLAAAGALNVSDAAEISASAMTQFKLSGDQIPHLADLLAAGAGKAQGSVHDLGEALNQAGLVASATGLTIEETTGGLAAFASAGLTGSDAGTSFKTMLQRLTPQSKEAQQKFDELGISAYDAQGNFVGLTDFAGQLQTKMAELTPEARNAAMSVMFGSDAVRASNVLYEQGAKGIQSWIDQVNDAGFAAETASIMQDNLAGDIEKLGGAFDTVFIQAGGTANEALRGLVQSAESLVDAIGNIPAPVLGIGTVLAGVAGGAALLGGAAINVIPKIRDTHGALKDMIPAGTRAGDVLRGVGKQAGTTAPKLLTIDAAMSRTDKNMRRAATAGKMVGRAIGGVGAALATAGFLASFQDTAKSVDEYTQAVLRAKDASSGESPFNEDFFNIDFVGSDAVKSLEDAFAQIRDIRVKGGGFGDWVNDAVFNLSGYKSSINAVEEAIGQYDTAAAGLASSGNTDAAASAFRDAAAAAEAQGLGIDVVAESFPRYLDHLRSLASESEVVLNDQQLLEWAMTGIAPAAIGAAGGTGELEGALAGVGGEAEETAASLDNIIASLFELGVLTRDVRSAEADFEAAIDGVTSSIAENGKTLDITTEKGRNNQAALDGLAASGQAYTESLAQSGASEKELQASMQGTYDSLISAAGQFGITGDKAKALAAELIGVPDGVDVQTWMDDSAKAMAEATANAIELIPGYTKVSVAVSEDGTVGQVQSRINSVTGKTEYIFVDDDGTVKNVQTGIANINGKDVPVYVGDDGTVYGTQGEINGIKGKDVTITATAATGGAESALASVARNRTAYITAAVIGGPAGAALNALATRGGYTGGLVGRLIQGRANGGLVPGQIPLNSQGDNVLAMVNGKPFGLRSGEMVVNEKATRKNLPLLQAINNGATIELPGFASGGVVGRAQDKVDRLQRQYSRMSGSKANRNRKLDLKDDLDAAKKELAAAKASVKAAEKSAKEAKKKADEARKAERERQSRLSEARFDLRRDLKRGEITDSFTSGSGMSVVDRLFEQSSNKDLSKGKRSSLRSTAYGIESQLLSLEKRSESLKTKLEKATEARDRLLEVSKSVASGLRGEYSLGGVLSNLLSGDQKGPLSAGSFVKSAQGKAAQIKRFGVMLSKLRKKGYNEAIIQEIADLGTTEGTQVGNALLGATGKERDQLNNAYKSMDYWSGKAGVEVTRSMERGGIDAAEGLVRGLEGKTEDVEDAFYKLGKNAEKAFKKSLGIHSPSKVMFGAGVNTGEGAELGILSKVGDVQSAAEQLMTPPSLTVPPSYEVSRYAQAQAAPIDYERLTNMVIAAARATPVEVPIYLDKTKLGQGIADIQKAATRGRPAAPFFAQK